MHSVDDVDSVTYMKKQPTFQNAHKSSNVFTRFDNCTVLNVICLPQSRLLTQNMQNMQEGTTDIMIANHRVKLTVGENKMRC